ncbi:MAG: RNA polymerase sigma-70 factor [Bacteroidetes bacterium]|nr:RNA polymerase sigma-70 factor [Bacteroidota bacterium]
MNDDHIIKWQQRISCFNDQQAYSDLFLHFYNSLNQFAYSILKSRQLAEEAVSDVFIKIWEKRSTINYITNLKLYLFTSTRNTALNYLKKQNVQHNISFDEYSVELNSIVFNPEEQLITSETLHKIQRAIHSLPPKCKLIFKLTKEEGLKYKEVAILLNLSVKTIENQMAIALKRISAQIGADIYHSISSTSKPF